MRIKRTFFLLFLALSFLTFAGATFFYDNSQLTFNNGTYTNTTYNNSGFVQLNNSALLGNFTSRIFDAGANTSWNSISWTPEVCYGCELPDNQTAESGFVNNNNMSRNVLLLHLNEPGTNTGPGGSDIRDYSGFNHNGNESGGVTFNASGRYRTGVSFDRVNDFLNFSNPSLLNNYGNQITLETWVRPGNFVNFPTMIDKDPGQFSLYFRSSSTTNPTRTQIDLGTSSGPQSLIGNVVHSANQWYHIVFTYNGSEMRLYHNGVLDSSDSATGTITPNSKNLIIGAGWSGSSVSFFFNGTMEEVAIYNRSLSQTEVANNYLRGVSRLNLTIRSCSTSDCSGVSWNATYTMPPHVLGVAPNRYFQYRAIFSTENRSFSPRLYNVSINYTGDVIPPSFSNFTEQPANTSIFSPLQSYRFNVTISGIDGGFAGISFDHVNYSVSNFSTVYNFTLSTLAAGTYPYYWWAYDGMGNYNTSSTRFYTILQADPNLTLNINPGTSFVFGTPLNASCGALGSGAITLYRNGIDVTSQNHQNITLAAGNYTYSCNVTASQNYSYAQTSVNVTISQATGSVTLLLNNNPANLTLTYPQAVNASTSSGTGAITLYRNGIDVTSQNHQNITLAAGFYNYTAISSGTGNYTAASATHFLNVTRGTLVVSLLMNGDASNISVPYAKPFNASATVSPFGTVRLYRDGIDVTSENHQSVLLAAGYYQYSANATGNENYTSSQTVSFYLNVTPDSPTSLMSILITPSANVVYGQTTSVQGLPLIGPQDLTYELMRNGGHTLANPNIEILNAGTYFYEYYTPGGQNYTSGVVNRTLVVNQTGNTVTLLLNNNPANLTLTYPQPINASASSTSGIISLFRNGIPIDSLNGQNVTLGGGNYTFLTNSTGNQNYMTNSTLVQFSLNMLPASSSIALYLNHSRNNITLYEGASLPINASLLQGSGVFSVYVNESILYSGSSSSFNTTTFATPGVYNITAIYGGNENYTRSSETWYATVLSIPDTQSPSIFVSSPRNITYALSSLLFNASLSENGTLHYSLDGGITNQSMSSSNSINFTSFNAGLLDGAYRVDFYANDSAGNTNSTFVYFGIDTQFPNITILSPEALNYSTAQLLVNISSDGSVWFSIGGANETYTSPVLRTFAQGTRTLIAYANDSAGNTNMTQVTFVVDSLAPTLSIISPSDGSVLGTNESLPLMYSRSDVHLDSCWYDLDGFVVNLPSCGNTTFNSLEGDHMLTIYANDTFGNLASATSNFSIVLGGPSIALTSPPNNAYLTTTAINFTYTPSDIDLAACSLWGDFNGTFVLNQTHDLSGQSGISQIFSLSLTESSYIWTVRCMDEQGNENAAANRTFHIDMTAPAVTIVEPVGTKSSLSAIPLTLALNDSSPLSCVYNITFLATGGIVSGFEHVSLPSCGNTTFSLIDETSYVLSLMINDSAGNVNYNVTNFTVDVPSSGTGTGSSGSGSGGGGGGGGSGVLSGFVGPSRISFGAVPSPEMRQGESTNLLVDIINTGTRFLNGCTVRVGGTMSSWASNNQQFSISSGERATYTIRLTVPRGIEPGGYNSNLIAQCNETTNSTVLSIDVGISDFDFFYQGAARSDVSTLLVNYSVAELVDRNQIINIDYSLVNTEDVAVTSGSTQLSLAPGSVEEGVLTIPLPKDVFGEFRIRLVISNGNEDFVIEEAILLPSRGITGFAISDANRRALSTLAIVILAVGALFFVWRTFKKPLLKTMPPHKSHSLFLKFFHKHTGKDLSSPFYKEVMR